MQPVGHVAHVVGRPNALRVAQVAAGSDAARVVQPERGVLVPAARVEVVLKVGAALADHVGDLVLGHGRPAVGALTAGALHQAAGGLAVGIPRSLDAAVAGRLLQNDGQYEGVKDAGLLGDLDDGVPEL